MTLSSEAFVAELDAQNTEALDRIARAACQGEPSDTMTVTKLLMLALKNELEATECAAAWLPTTPEVNVKLALARQAGDEAKHYRMIQARLMELGIVPEGDSSESFAAYVKADIAKWRRVIEVANIPKI